VDFGPKAAHFLAAIAPGKGGNKGRVIKGHIKPTWKYFKSEDEQGLRSKEEWKNIPVSILGQ
jgi:hypothetical protein